MTTLRATATSDDAVLPRARRPRRRILPLLLAFVVVALVAAIALAAVPVLRSAWALTYVPTMQDGALSTPAALDSTAPAIARLDPALHAALDEAARAAADAGIDIRVTSGWRSRDYQQWLFDDAAERYGSDAVASEWVASPDTSSHVTGHAVDIASVDAQYWLIQHGATWGLCQIYANERWHFELATTPGGECPALRTDAAG
jgi:zinc D-Ala-D-Ala carboxypeptidase